MSACDEGWGGDESDEYDDERYCPCAYRYGGEGRAVGCRLKVWHEWLKGISESRTPPDYCSYAPILKLLVEAKEILKTEIAPITDEYFDRGMIRRYPIEPLEVKFWVRRA